MTTEIPTLETQRLILRAHRAGDFSQHAAMWADPVVTRFLGGALSREQAWIRFLRHAGMWHFAGYGFWLVEDKTTGRYLGEAGFLELKRDIEPSLEGTLEAGWGLVADAHGKGIATEAVGCFLAWGAEKFPGMSTRCIIDPVNTGSIRVAEKHGFAEIARTSYHGAPITMFER